MRLQLESRSKKAQLLLVAAVNMHFAALPMSAEVFRVLIWGLQINFSEYNLPSVSAGD